MIKEFCMGFGALTAVVAGIALTAGAIKLAVYLMPYTMYILFGIFGIIILLAFVAAMWALGKVILNQSE